MFHSFLKVWHYHPELELVTILKSSGTRFIGDSIEQFNEGDVVLIGKNLPHMWLNDIEYFNEKSIKEAESIDIHFKLDFVGEYFFKIPEMNLIEKLLKNANLGIKFSGDLTQIIKQIKKIHALKGFNKVIEFIQLLNQLAKHESYKLLSSPGFVNSFNKTGKKNLDKIYEYIFENFREPISLNDVSEISNMNPSAFSRFFKRVNRKTFSEYLIEVRIGYACKLLIQNKYNISEVCYESGFNNISNFNRQFKKVTKLSPSDYSKQYSKMNNIKS